jgi:hypothetical protein
LDQDLHPPQISPLPGEQGSVHQVVKVILIMGLKIVKDILVGMLFEIFTANLNRHHFFIAQRWGKSTPAN